MNRLPGTADGLLAVVDAARAGDRPALEALLARISEVASALARASCPDRAEAEDILQESLLDVCTSISRLADGRSFWPWFRRIVRHNATDRGRRRAVRREVPIEGAATARAERPAADSAEFQRELLAALNDLAEDLREMLTLRHEAGLSLDEIAALTGCSVRAVESRLYRARQALRRKVDSLVK
jgi:RNA polymerase sigma factor (sigma-70 family)